MSCLWTTTYKSIPNFLTTGAVKTLICSLVLSCIDYCNSLLAGLPQCLLKKIQYVQNAATKMIFQAPKSDHVLPLLRKLHWLPISCRTEHKISSLCYSSLSGTGPQYLSDFSSRCIHLLDVFVLYLALTSLESPLSKPSSIVRALCISGSYYL